MTERTSLSGPRYQRLATMRKFPGPRETSPNIPFGFISTIQQQTGKKISWYFVLLQDTLVENWFLLAGEKEERISEEVLKLCDSSTRRELFSFRKSFLFF